MLNQEDEIEKFTWFLDLRTISKTFVSVTWTVLKVIPRFNSYIVSHIDDFSFYGGLTSLTFKDKIRATQLHSLLCLPNLRKLKVLKDCHCIRYTLSMSLLTHLTSITLPNYSANRYCGAINLGYLTRLTTINLIDPGLKTISDLLHTENLEKLSIEYRSRPVYNANILSFTPLRTQFKNLKKLSIHFYLGTISDIDSISLCTQLTSLNICGLGQALLNIDYIVKSLTNLENLDIHNILISSNNMLDSITHLTRLSCCNVLNTSENRSITKLTKLTELEFVDCRPFDEVYPDNIKRFKITDDGYFPGFTCFTNLVSLDIQGHNTTLGVDIEDWTKLCNLQRINLIGCIVDNPHLFTYFTDLCNLRIANCSTIKSRQQILKFGLPKYVNFSVVPP